MKPNIDDLYKTKKAVVLGPAKSGLAVTKLLTSLRTSVTVLEQKDTTNQEIMELKKSGVTFIFGKHPEEVIDKSVDFVVKNPGIPYSTDIVQKALSMHIPVLTEAEIAFQVSDSNFISITGTNGKTTTTTLVGEILKNAKITSRIAGNIGKVLSDEVCSSEENEWIVTELSRSSPLKAIPFFFPLLVPAKICIFLSNIEALSLRNAFKISLFEIISSLLFLFFKLKLNNGCS